MDLFGSHRITVEALRRLAVECHALDVSAVHLLLDTTIDDPSSVRQTYEELFSEKLLLLAIAIRTKFYQGVPSAGTERFVSHSAFLMVNERETIQALNIKDFCDKVIHAESITRPLAGGIAQPVTQIRGSQGGVPWTLDVSTGLFCQGVLNWLGTLHQQESKRGAV